MADDAQVAIEFVTKGFAEFISNFGKATKAIEGFGRMTENRLKAIQSMNAGIVATAKATATQVTALAKLQSQQQRTQQATLNLAATNARIVSSQNNLSAAQQKTQQAAMKLATAQAQQVTSANNLAAAQVRLQIAQINAANAAMRNATAQQQLSVSQQNANTKAQALLLSQQKFAVQQQQAASATTQLQGALSATSIVTGLATGALGLLGKATNSVADFLKNGLGKALDMVKGAFASVINVGKRFVSSLADIAKNAAGVFTGLVSFDIFRGITNQIKEMTKETLEAVASFQGLYIQFTALAARDIANEFGIPMAESMGMAAQKAESLLEWVKNIAVTTPYTVQSLSKILALGNAFGLATTQAKALTMAVGNFTSAMGLEDEAMWRIIYNFGQMHQIGRLTGREFRDLAVSFVPVWDILDEMAREAGIATEEFRQMAFEGGVPVEKFFQKFIDMVGRDFPNAMEKMARTWQGVQGNIKDFLQVILGIEILGPIIDKMTGMAADALTNALSPAVRMTADVIGQVLLHIFENMSAIIDGRLIPAIKELAEELGFSKPSIEGFVQAMARTYAVISRAVEWLARGVEAITRFIDDAFQKPTKNMFAYGQGLVMAFANGMASAISWVIKVIAQIANIIAGWFAPGSPPKVAPEIDKWGAETAKLWWSGWGDAAVNAAKEISGNIHKVLLKPLPPSEYLRPFPQTPRGGGGGNVDVTRTATTSVFDSAGVTSATSNIQKAIVDITGDIMPYIRRWGAQVAQTWWGQWGSGTFDIFNSISDTFEKFIRSMPGWFLGEEDDKMGMLKSILGVREVVARAMDGVRQGLLSVADAANKVTTAFGNTGKEFTAYITGLFEVEAATAALEKAESEFDAIQEISLDNMYKIDRIMQRIGDSTRDAALSYVDALNDVAKAEKDVEESELALEEIADKYETKLSALRAELESLTEGYDEEIRLGKIEAAMNTGLLTDEEKRRLEVEKRKIELNREIRATEQQRDVEVGAAEDRVDAAKEYLELVRDIADQTERSLRDMAQAELDRAQAQKDAATEQLKASQAMIESQVKQNELIKEMIELMEAAAKAAGGGGAGEPAVGGMPIPQEPGTGKTSKPKIPDWQNIFSEALADMNKFLDEIEGKFTSIISPHAIAEMQASLDTARIAITVWWYEDVQPILDKLKQWWEDNGETVKTGFGEIFDRMIENITTVAGAIFDDALGNLEALADFFERASGIKTDTGLMKIIADIITWPLVIPLIISKTLSFLLRAVLHIMSYIAMVTRAIELAKERWGAIWEEIKRKTAEKWTEMVETVRDKVNEIIEDHIKPFLTNAYNFFFGEGQGIDKIKTEWENKWTEMRDKVSEVLTAIFEEHIKPKIEAIKTFLEDPAKGLAYIKKFWGEKFDEMLKKVTDFVRDVTDGLFGPNKGLNWLITKFTDFKTRFIDPFILGIGDINTKFSGLVTWIGDLAEALANFDIKALWALLRGSPTPLAVGIDDVNKAMARMDTMTLPRLAALASRVATGTVAPPYGSTSSSIDRSVHVEVNPTYRNVQSPSSIYYDVSAALAVATAR